LIPFSSASRHPLPDVNLSEIDLTASKLKDQVPTMTAILTEECGGLGNTRSNQSLSGL